MDNGRLHDQLSVTYARTHALAQSPVHLAYLSMHAWVATADRPAGRLVPRARIRGMAWETAVSDRTPIEHMVDEASLLCYC
jgi:hypothetical protein